MGKRIAIAACLVAAGAAPFLISGFHTFQLTQILVYAIALLGLNLLTGYSGQISLGHGAFFAIGAYVTAIMLDHAWLPYWATVPLAGLVCFAVGFAFGLPALRLEGPYLALATFALAIATPQILKHDKLESWTGGVQGIVLDKPEGPFAGLLDPDQWLYFVTLAAVIALYVAAWNLVRGRTAAPVAIRDQRSRPPPWEATSHLQDDHFGLSAMFTAWPARWRPLTGFVSPDSFTILVSINFLSAWWWAGSRRSRATSLAPRSS